MKRCHLATALLALSLCMPLLTSCRRDKGSATPQAAQELAELRAEQELSFTHQADSELQAELAALLSRFDKTADARLASEPHRITLLHLACVYKKPELARCLLQDGADPNARMMSLTPSAEMAKAGPPTLTPGDTPLTWATLPHRDNAVQQDMLPLINLLVENGADVNQPGPMDMPPLQTATLLLSPAGEAVVLRLLELGADPKADMPQPLCPAVAANGWHRALAALLDAGAVDTAGALHAAADNAEVEGALDCARLLLERGAEVNAPNAENATPLYIAAHALSTPEGGEPELVEPTVAMIALLLQHGADPQLCCDADPEFPGSCAADFIAMSPAAQEGLAARGLSVPRRPIRWEAEGDAYLAEVCRASIFESPAADIAPHATSLASLLTFPAPELAHSPLYADASGHAVKLLARVDAAHASALVAQLPLWQQEEAWKGADARTAALMEAILTTPELVMPREQLLAHARRMDAWGVSEVAALLTELLERDPEAEADIEPLCSDTSPALRAGALTARLLRAGLPAPRNGAVAEWMAEQGLEAESAPDVLRRALLLTSLEKFWYGDMPAEEVRALLEEMRRIGAPRAAAFYTELAPNLSNPEELDRLMAPGGPAELARFELECATALFLWSQREALLSLCPREPANAPQN